MIRAAPVRTAVHISWSDMRSDAALNATTQTPRKRPANALQTPCKHLANAPQAHTTKRLHAVHTLSVPAIGNSHNVGSAHRPSLRTNEEYGRQCYSLTRPHDVPCVSCVIRKVHIYMDPHPVTNRSQLFIGELQRVAVTCHSGERSARNSGDVAEFKRHLLNAALQSLQQSGAIAIHHQHRGSYKLSKPHRSGCPTGRRPSGKSFGSKHSTSRRCSGKPSGLNVGAQDWAGAAVVASRD